MDTLTPQQRSERMSRIRSRETKPELLVRRSLHAAGWRFRVAGKRYPGKPDVVVPKAKTIIDIRGCFWHRHGCPPPVYEVNAGNPGDIMVRIDAAPDAIIGDSQGKDGATNGAIKDGRPIRRPIKRPIKDALLEAIKRNPGISRPNLMDALGKGRTVVTEALASLQKDGKIEHRGSRKTGGYFAR